MRQTVNHIVSWVQARLFSRENLYALVLCLILILLVIVTAGVSPLWIYQGF
jgi:predicted PurR-regulated permease PerM